MALTARAPWQNPRILSTLVLVFLAGAASGALWMRVLHDSRRPVALSTTGPQSRREDPMLQKFKVELGLSPAQTEKIALVLDDYSQYYQSLQDQLDDMRATGKTRILQILDPGQRDKFNTMMNDLAPELANPASPSK
jgi:hypothetical protein